MLLILFGVPGAGKSFAGHLLRDEFGISFHDADHELPDTMRHALAHKLPVTDDMRGGFFERVIEVTQQLMQQHEHLAIAQAFMKEHHRRMVLDAFPQAHFILVTSRQDLIEQRFRQRDDYLIDLDDARRIAEAFEPPQVPHCVLPNNGNRDQLRAELAALLNDHLKGIV